MNKLINWWNRNKLLTQENNELKDRLLLREKQLVDAAAKYSAIKAKNNELEEKLILKQLHITLLEK